MSLDKSLLSTKLKKYREQFQLSIEELTNLTGIKNEALQAYEKKLRIPSGDEILILADFYKCDYKFFISNDVSAPFEQTETLFRKHGDEFLKEDRWAIQEFLFLAECEKYLLNKLDSNNYLKEFNFSKQSNNHKKNGIQAAKKLRTFLNYESNEVRMDIYDDFRKIGIRTFRRRLSNSRISGLYIKHPIAGKCILINYNEDIYRQRFTAAHEAAHAILNDDEEEGVLVSFKTIKDYREVGANNFASQYLMPPEFLKKIPEPNIWNPQKALSWSNKLKVSTEALAYALKNAKLIDNDTEEEIKKVRVQLHLKSDPELPESLSPKAKKQKTHLMEKGLSSYYVNLCFKAYRNKMISASRVCEMFLVEQNELSNIADLYNEVF